MKTLLTLSLMIAGAFWMEATPDAAPAASNIGSAEHPKIDSDLRATFRIKAPEARNVQVRGGAGLVSTNGLSLARSEDGAWLGTTAPAVPGFHYYWFVVDGLNVNDPASYSYFGYGRETSGIELPEKGVDFYDAKEGVPHGEVR